MFSIWSLLREKHRVGGGGAGGERWREEEKSKHTDRRGGRGQGGKRGSREKWRPGEGGGERKDQGDQRGASDSEGAARPICWRDDLDYENPWKIQ